ncbi:MAG: Na+/H+ antiporter NhaC family protein [Candidatus Marinimicrobia bacterium]|nr:Na+/H+ antiporter NhaC family protein [Candidatus Neomarinimicrobiota bacterium]MCF7830088.1 Na+/H+ antiporter NhaC family protein [Candidatus Neomarinimicrobiota bacterium]MCF7882135.1 Na+/H+ antiporter NhaC family protein [Candidatus Neomarinimicrobiota bacterium]
MALLTRQILLSLFAGIWLGAIFVYDYSLLDGLLRLLDTYLVDSLTEPSHASIILFTLAFGGMVGVLAKNGGMQGIVDKISKLASGNRSGQLSTMAMGLLIFFDDYANTLLVGNTMRVLTDKLRISREKLAYIVDSTAAPVTSIAIISTWVGFEIGLMQEAFASVGIQENIYFVFIQTIQYRFYSLFALVFVFLVAYTRRDFGPMYKAERRSIHTGAVLSDGATPLADTSELEIPAGIPYRWYNAIIPIGAVIFIMIAGLFYSGLQSMDGTMSVRLWEIIGEADSFQVLIWASFGGSFVAMLLSVGQRIMSISESIEAWLGGAKAMILAVAVLILAWALSRICGEIQTAEYIIEMTEGLLRPELIPVLTFITAAIVSFATGTSWGTMAILIPIVIPLMAELLRAEGIETTVDAQSFLATFAAVLSGSVFGDHCSPISDTTILSSMASGSDHIDHVRTQIPYAVTVGIIAILFGYLPAGLHWNWPLFFGLGLASLIAVILFIGKQVEARENIEI